MTGLPLLWSFSVWGNQLSGPLPEFSALPGLWGFQGSHNQFSGPIPSLTGATELRGLHLHDNQLSGPLPSLAGLTKLENLWVSENRLTGTLPDISGIPLAAGGSALCRNYFTPASNPPSANDVRWNTATAAADWSAQCSGLPEGRTMVEYRHRDWSAQCSGLPEGRTMVEYRHRDWNYYFMTSSPENQANVEAMPQWERTGNTFWAYAASASSLKPLKRFFFPEIARARQRGTHFYSLEGGETQLLEAMNPGNAYASGLPFYEGVEAYAASPTVPGLGGACASDMVPVYRVFRGAALSADDANHRFTTNPTLYNQLVAAGWEAEGVHFCVPVR